MTEWSDIAKALRYIAEYWTNPKLSDGCMEISFSNEGKIYVDILAYGSQTMGRRHNIGPFNSEEEAKAQTKALLRKECLELIDFLQKAEEPIFEIPSVLLG